MTVRETGRRMRGMKPSVRVWALFVLGVLVTVAGLGAVVVTATDRMAEVEASIVLADGVDPTLRGVVELRTSRLFETIRSGLVPGPVTVSPYNGEDISQMNAYTDSEERVLIRSNPGPGGYYWGFDRRPYFEPSAMLVMAGIGILVASALFAATCYTGTRTSNARASVENRARVARPNSSPSSSIS
jgi:hypothetical protein